MSDNDEKISLVEEGFLASFSSLWSSNPKIRHVNYLKECVDKCQIVINETNTVLKSLDEYSLDIDTAFQFWSCLEEKEKELIEIIVSSDINVESSSFRTMFLFSQGNSILAEMQQLKRRFISFFRHSKIKGHKGLRTIMSTSKKSLNSLSRLIGNTDKFSDDFREKELRLIDQTLLLQRTVLLTAQGEDDIMFDINQSQESKETGWRDIFRDFIGFNSDDDDDDIILEEEQKEEYKSKLTTENSDNVTTATTTKATAIKNKLLNTQTDLHLMNLSLKGAFLAASCQHHFIAANNFGFVLKLLSAKCYSLEELVATAFSLAFNNEKEVLKKKNEKIITESFTKKRILSILKNVHPEILPQSVSITNYETATPPYSISLLFVSLIWNTAFSLWRKGCVKQAFQWLSVVDVERLKNITLFKENNNEKEEINEKFSPLNWSFIINNCERSQNQSNKSDLFNNNNNNNNNITQQENGDNCKKEKHNSSIQLNEILHRITSLRDLCSIMIHCTTPNDILYILFKLDYALKCQRRKMKDKKETFEEKEIEITGNSLNDAAAEVLSIIFLIVEYYLANRAARVVSFKMSPTSSHVSLHMAVRHVCDELISFLSSERLSGINDIQQHGLPSSWHGRRDDDDDDDDDDENNNNNNNNMNTKMKTNQNNQSFPLGPMWLTIQVLGITQAFASGFNNSDFFQNALAMSEEKVMKTQLIKEKTELTGKWSIWPMSLVNNIHSAATTILKGNNNALDENSNILKSKEGITTSSSSSFLNSSNGQERKQRKRGSSLLAQRSNNEKYKYLTESTPGKGMLWLPSQNTNGIALLCEENSDNGPYSGSEELSLRLLTIACRYSESQNLISFENNHIKDNNNDKIYYQSELLNLIIPKLSKVIGILSNTLNDFVGPIWLTKWRQQKSFSSGRASTRELLNILIRSTDQSKLELKYKYFNNQASNNTNFSLKDEKYSFKEEDKRVGEESHEEILTSMNLKDFQTSHNEKNIKETKEEEEEEEEEKEKDENDNTEVVWDSLMPVYTPEIIFDYSAFTSSNTTGVLLATRKLVEDAARAQEELEKATAEGKQLPKNNNNNNISNIKGISILNSAARRIIHDELPIPYQFQSWRLIYSTKFHGRSFSNMIGCSLRELEAAKDRRRQYHQNQNQPMLLILELIHPSHISSKDTNQKTNLTEEEEEEMPKFFIGVYLSDALHFGTRRFYGSCETFVFHLLLPSSSSSSYLSISSSPQIHLYRATGANAQYINCTPNALVIGGGGGSSIYLNENMSNGSTAACATFNSPPLTQWGDSSSCLSWSTDTIYNNNNYNNNYNSERGVSEGGPAKSYSFEIKDIELLVVGN